MQGEKEAALNRQAASLVIHTIPHVTASAVEAWMVANILVCPATRGHDLERAKEGRGTNEDASGSCLTRPDCSVATHPTIERGIKPFSDDQSLAYVKRVRYKSSLLHRRRSLKEEGDQEEETMCAF